MNRKENALRIIKFNEPEFVAGEIACHSLSYLGCNHEGYLGGGHHLPVGSKWVDIWNTEWHKEHEGVMGFPRGNPLADMDNLSSYQWPNPDDARINQQIYDNAKDFHGGDVFLSGSHRDTLWEKAYMLVGMENMMEYFYTEPEYAREILHRIMDFQLGIAKHYIKLGIEIAHLGDDLGTQSSLILSPQIIQEFLYPEYKRLFDFYGERNVLINFHSCGHIEPLLEFFIDLGVNILNPVQATANDLGKVRSVTQGRMALCGGISSSLLMSGPVSKIKEEVREKINQLGKTGGYFCVPDQSMPYPTEYMKAYQDALQEFGRYPLQNKTNERCEQ